MLHPRTYEGRPLWGRAVYTALHGARLSSVPSGDQSANPASVPGRSGFQRAFLSVSSAQKCSGAGRLATPSGVSRAARSAVPSRSSAPGHRASRSKYTRDQSWETGSLSRLFGSMETAAKCVSMGHAHCRTRLCGALPQPFYGGTPIPDPRTGGHERSKDAYSFPITGSSWNVLWGQSVLISGSSLRGSIGAAILARQTSSSAKGLDAMVQSWLRLRLYAFPRSLSSCEF